MPTASTLLAQGNNSDDLSSAKPPFSPDVQDVGQVGNNGPSSVSIATLTPPSQAKETKGGPQDPLPEAAPAKDEKSEQALVLSYLQKHGLHNAADQLRNILKNGNASDGQNINEPGGRRKRRREDDGEDDSSDNSGGNGDNSENGDAGEAKKKSSSQIDYDVDDEMEDDDEMSQDNNSGDSSSRSNGLSSSTGGGIGYDLDAAPAIALWGAGHAPSSLKNQNVSSFLLEGREKDAQPPDPNATSEKGTAPPPQPLPPGLISIRDEARRYVEGFTSLVTWILTLPDDPANPIVSPSLLNKPPPFSRKDDPNCPREGIPNQAQNSPSVASEHDKIPANTLSLPLGATSSIPPSSAFHHDLLLLPPSCKPELLSLSFPLLVHTYCELLSCGLEKTALALLDTYRHLYEPQHPAEISDLDNCDSTSAIVELNNNVVAHNAVQSEVRGMSGQIALGQKRKAELEANLINLKKSLANLEETTNNQGNAPGNAEEEKRRLSAMIADHERQITKCAESLSRLRPKVDEVSIKLDAISTKLSKLPFLRRARALKWQITLSTSSYGALTAFVSSRDELVPMSALLQSRCHLIVERRDPLPFCPPAVLEDMALGAKGGTFGGEYGKDKVRWAAPIHPNLREKEAGSEVNSDAHSGTILRQSEGLPFPKFKLEEGEEGKIDARSAVEFNRALLINGFRRLEALELKREYEAGLLRTSATHDRAGHDGGKQREVADPLQPSVLLGSLCSSSDADTSAGLAPSRTPWRESNIGIVSAAICPPDGRKVAIGCDDAAVRVWSLDRTSESVSANGQHGSDAASLGEPSMVLLGHKNGFPVFDVDWIRNGRTLLSAGGDGTIRMWDTQAVGPYGRLSNVLQQKSGTPNMPHHHGGGLSSTSLSSVMIPGSKPEPLVEVGGAALAVYHGHAPSTPVWSVSSAPSGYYFASAGSDFTARIWSTDRASPVRLLTGHISPSINCITWHPNSNYVVTASDDKTCRMWDIQNGQCVRLLSGSARGMNLVRVSPSGRYLAGAGYDNIVRLWDLGNGRLINEFRATQESSNGLNPYSEGMIHSMTFSSCGTALAVSGEDCVLRIWDVRGAESHLSNPDYFAATRGSNATSSISDGFAGTITPSQLNRMPMNERARPGTRVPTRVFKTNNVSLLDLKYTKRNLLLAVGNYSG